MQKEGAMWIPVNKQTTCFSLDLLWHFPGLIVQLSERPSNQIRKRLNW